jgi:acetolactate synthase-1/2/3 large subunit/sulfoacetaldehyde acetyltransferase
MNNNCWGSEKAYQKYFYRERYIGCDITNPPLDAFARLFGAKGYRAQTAGQIGDMLRDALDSGLPSVIEVPIDPEDLPMPGRAVDAVR